MRILVTNDDGIHAPGLDVAAEIARALSDDVWVIAPELDQSGVAHSLSLNDPLRMREITERRFAIKGTPTDCVIMGVRHILDRKGPDLVISGVNRGSNTGEDVTYSGTIAGAMEGTILGIPSVALSQAYGPDTRLRPHWQTALHFAPDLIRKVLAESMPRDVLVNINFPDCPPDQVKGVAVTSQGRRAQEWIRIDPRHDGRGIPYFWIAFARAEPPSPTHGTDLAAIADQRIAVTPLRVDMTDEPFMTRLAQVLD
ncbi:MAG: 5'/3'-nucleotidase SurE [Xanthobacteraceae bacterium]